MGLTSLSDALTISSDMPLSPDWKNLPRRKCDDCGKTYKPVRPLLEGQRGFCCANCRKSYHKHGGAYRKLKHELKKMVAKELASLIPEAVFVACEKRFRQIVREEMETATVCVQEITEGGETCLQGSIRPARTSSTSSRISAA